VRPTGFQPATIALLLAPLASALLLDRLGVASRGVGAARRPGAGADVEVVRDERELHQTWREAGARGRVLVWMGSHLHLEPADRAPRVDGLLARPGTGALAAAYRERLGHRNHLWVALRTGLVRRLHLVLPERVIRRRHPAPDLSAVADRMDLWGAPVTVTARVPSIAEPVLLGVDASWFEEDDGGALLEALRGSGLVSDLVTVSLSEGSPDVSPAARERARAFAAALGRGAGR